MTFTTSLKEEMSKTDFSIVEAQNELISFLNCLGKFSKDELIITMENASVARRIYKEIKAIYKVSPSITIRMQKRFKVKQIYILTIKDNIDLIKEAEKISFSKLSEKERNDLVYLSQKRTMLFEKEIEKAMTVVYKK